MLQKSTQLLNAPVSWLMCKLCSTFVTYVQSDVTILKCDVIIKCSVLTNITTTHCLLQMKFKHLKIVLVAHFCHLLAIHELETNLQFPHIDLKVNYPLEVPNTSADFMGFVNRHLFNRFSTDVLRPEQNVPVISPI